MVQDPVADLKPGLPVYTIDGDQIGAVKEVGEAAFKVDAPFRPDYWLKRDAVQAFTVERVTLKITEDQLGAWKVDGDSAG